MGDMGMPDALVDGISHDPDMQALAPTMLYDLAVMGDDTRRTIPEDLVRAITVPTLVLAGGDSPDFFRAIATRIAEVLPNGQYQVLDGSTTARRPRSSLPSSRPSVPLAHRA